MKPRSHAPGQFGDLDGLAIPAPAEHANRGPCLGQSGDLDGLAIPGGESTPMRKLMGCERGRLFLYLDTGAGFKPGGPGWVLFHLGGNRSRRPLR